MIIRKIYLFVPIVVSSLVSIALFSFYLRFITPVNFDELALGEEATPVFNYIDSKSIHCQDLIDADKCITEYKESNIENLIVLLGNSQIHAINQSKAGDETLVPIIHRELLPKGAYFVALSQPNASLQEHYLLFEYLKSKMDIKFLVLPVVFDDTRETGVRNTIAGVFDDRIVTGQLISTELGKTLLDNYSEKDTSRNNLNIDHDTIQQKVEYMLNDKLDLLWEGWKSRESIRGDLFVFLYQFRNWLFNITPSSTRRKIPGRYAMNITALKEIISSAKNSGTKVLIYVVPLRNDVKIPYNLDEYSDFKMEVEILSQDEHVSYLNLENLVPSRFWGTKSSTVAGGGDELDFMHFQAGGHKILADSLSNRLSVLLNLGVSQ